MALMNATADFGASTSEDSEYDAAVASGDIRNVMAVLEREYKLPTGYLAKTAQVESRMNPNAQNPRSSAGGLFQFLDSTAKRYGLTDKMDPVASTLAAAQLAGDNADSLSSRLGREPTTPELYVAHQQGAGGAAKILSNPSAPMASLVGGEAARLNGAAGLTGGQFIDRFAQKLGMPSTGRSVSTAPTADLPAEGASEASFNGGLMNRTAEAYQPAKQDNLLRNAVMALGQSIASGKRGDYTGGFSTNLNALQASDEKRDDRRYDMWRDQRNFGLQERQVSMTAEERKTDNARADAQLDLAKQNAARPDRITTASGAVMDLPRDGSAPVERVPGQKAVTLAAQQAERRAAAKAAGLQEGTPAFTTYELTGRMANEDKASLSAGDKQAIFKAEDALPGLDQTIETLQRAKVLNPKTYVGVTAQALGRLGTSGTFDSFFDQEKAKATREFGQIMSMEAIQSMSQTLKGATTDAEMARFMEILGDPSTPPEIRGRTIDRLSVLAQRQKEIAESRAKDLRGGDYFKNERAARPPSAPASAPSASPSPAAGPTRAELEAEARRRGLIQ